MFDQLSLFMLLLTPVIAYIAGAMVFSFVGTIRKGSIKTKFDNNIFHYRNGL